MMCSFFWRFVNLKLIKLQRLFQDTIDQDKTDSRIYEAFWDHQYSVREIADFLNEREQTVERKLDEYDDRG